MYFMGVVYTFISQLFYDRKQANFTPNMLLLVERHEKKLIKKINKLIDETKTIEKENHLY